MTAWTFSMMSHEDWYGYTSALVCIVAFGSFAVPIKCKAARQVNVDPLVLQTYKIAAAFLTSWLVLLWGVPFSFSPWGFVSGLFMVPGGTAGYYGVQMAGLATAQGIWCSLKVLVAFGWGLLVFHEPVRSLLGTLTSIGFMIVGLVGMSYFSSIEMTTTSTATTTTSNDGEAPPIYSNTDNTMETESTMLLMNQQQRQATASTTINNDDEEAATINDIDEEIMYFNNDHYNHRNAGVESSTTNFTQLGQTPGGTRRPRLDSAGTASTDSDMGRSESLSSFDSTRPTPRYRQQLWGILGATIDGAYGGSVLVPMHYAAAQAQGGGSSNNEGLGYLISFGIGCSSVVALVWLLRWLLHAWQQQATLSQAWQALPSLHLTTVGPYASLAGLIWSLGNVSSILSVTYLGQGLGYSITQSQLLIAGLWGVFGYGEIQDPRNVQKWFASAAVTLVGILFLSQQHISMPKEEEAGGHE
eukprot:CAMPEP_0172452002 /NCGR_PEP_ID=MMETSP1065-20121228/9790_1 /TAXON_ID=265537 /ORGANISM="Amphiprora paludosa, Strain CCMP125" /LENGTH=470 /DNA_ID=CAMNT_0013203983 /DNA_START=8 /DNA_END=1420 /DNA_ORIENTATION=-